MHVFSLDVFISFVHIRSVSKFTGKTFHHRNGVKAVYRLRLAMEDTALLISLINLQILSFASISSSNFTFNVPGIINSNINISNIVKQFTVYSVVIFSFHKLQIRMFIIYIASFTF